MGREVPFDPKDICDACGKEGAYDFMGDLYCPDCVGEYVYDDEEGCEHLHWNQEGNGGDHSVSCLDCGASGYIEWYGEHEK